MGEVTEKIYCCDRGDNDNALAAAILAGNNRRDDWGPMAAMMGGGMNNWMNNLFAYLMFMALLRNGGFGFGGDGAGTATQGIETQAQLNAIRTQLQDNQNADCIKSTIQGNGSAAAMFRLLFSKSLARLVSLLNVLSTLLTSVTATSSRLCRIAAARLSARLPISAQMFSSRLVSRLANSAMASVILALQLHKVSQLLLSRLSKISAIFFVPVRTILNASSTL